MSENTLQEQIIRRYGEDNLKKLTIPSHIVENLAKELREYQIEALRLYLANNESLKARHLMFNMATGSGKTLIMAALMLDCYKRGYRDFIFFVNATSILEKTRANFSDSTSNKYLFTESICIDSTHVGINVVQNLNESKEGCINIYFSTIQGLFSLLKDERENGISFDDLRGRKLVFLADEAHHLNSETKKKLTQDESREKESWESIITKAFSSHNENLLFEFSATIPKDKAVLEKYRNKIVYEYDLRHFCENGYAKRIFLVKYEDFSLESRFLGAMLLSLYREYVAHKHRIFLKPVVLFKSESIKESYANEAAFVAFVNRLDSKIIEDFFKGISTRESNKDNVSLLTQSQAFFKAKFGQSFSIKVAELAKSSFAKSFILNANEDKEVEKRQILLNSLEDRDNEVRVIFAVDKLNEGWDVLNLFDIVRLKQQKPSKAKDSDKKSKIDGTTTKEVQLIGRGARLYPFPIQGLDSSLEFRRKFDSDLGNPLSILERLSYHTLNEVGFISELEKQMTKSGLLFENPKKRVVLKISEKAKAITQENELYYIKNMRKKGDEIPTLFNYERFENMQEAIMPLAIPLFSQDIQEKEVHFSDKVSDEEGARSVKNLCDVVAKEVFYKAINQLQLRFDTHIKPFGFVSKREFIESFGTMALRFDTRQDFSNRNNQLEIAKFVLRSFKEQVQTMQHSYIATAFEIHRLRLEEQKEIFSTKDFKQSGRYEWLYYDKYSLDSEPESDFLSFINEHKEMIDKSFSAWIIVRNDGFSEFKIYDNREILQSHTPHNVAESQESKTMESNKLDVHKGESSDTIHTTNPTYAQGFEPDFIFFGKRVNDNSGILSIECFIEAKGEHLAGDENTRGKDTWKEEFLQSLKGKTFNIVSNQSFTSTQALTIHALPFFKARSEQYFSEKFRAFLNNDVARSKHS